MAAPVDRTTIQVKDWPGLQTNAGPMGSDDPGSALEQTNLRANVPGTLSARPGYRKAEFDEES